MITVAIFGVKWCSLITVLPPITFLQAPSFVQLLESSKNKLGTLQKPPTSRFIKGNYKAEKILNHCNYTGANNQREFIEPTSCFKQTLLTFVINTSKTTAEDK
jgi:hypothetical protein